ncbi:MAG: ABC transporter permease [bacterium]|nr:ABC transporter permease [bacterium]
MIWELISEALTTLRTNWMRTILTMIGIILGVASVVAIMNLGQSAYTTAEEEITDTGYGNIKIYKKDGLETNLPLNQTVINILQEAEIEQVAGYEPQFYGFGATAYNSDGDSVEMSGGYRGSRDVEKLTFLAGYPFSEDDIAEKSQVTVVDEYTAKEVFGSPEAALGETLRLNNGNLYRIIGVTKNESLFEPSYGRMYLPKSLGELEPLAQTYGYSYIDVNLKVGSDYEAVAEDIEQALMDSYGFTDEDEMVFTVENVKDIIAELSVFFTAFSIGLSLIAAISLLVGGVGIMNIMLVNVTERTKEIGLMKALGAQEKDITFQFLIEAIVLTICGGIIGVAIGVGGSFLIIWLSNTFVAPSGYLPKFNFVVSQQSILVSLTVSMLIGLIFGSYPAKKAARLDPVEALRRD